MGEDDVVPDSEELDSEILILFEPLDEEPFTSPQKLDDEGPNIVSPATHGSIESPSSAGHVSAVDCNSNVPTENQSAGRNDRSEEASPGLRWSLRKRKALQKMPYSLERIRYKQQLEGYDVSNFDEISNRVNIPNVEALRESAALEIAANIDGSEEDTSWEPSTPVHVEVADDQHFSSSNNKSEGNAADIHSDSTDGDSDASSDSSGQEEVIFRGRKVNIKTGYRGILPKIAWEREMVKNGAMTPKRTRISRRRDKGVAIRKVHSVRKNQDDKLLSEMIVTDDATTDPNNDEEFYIKNNQELVDNDELEVIDHYYQDRYGDGYVTDSLSDPDKIESSLESLSDCSYQTEHNKQRQHNERELQIIDNHSIPPHLLLLDSDLEDAPYDSSGAKPVVSHSLIGADASAREYDAHIINPMLHSRKRSRMGIADVTGKNRTYKKSVHRRLGSRAPRILQRRYMVQKRSVRRSPHRHRQEHLHYIPTDERPEMKTRSNLEELSPLKQTRGRHYKEPDTGNNGQQRGSLKKRRYSASGETTQPFVTIVEAMSGSFAKVNRRKFSPLGSAHPEYSSSKMQGPLEDILQCLKTKKTIVSSTVVKTSFSEREYTLSVYSPSEALKTLGDMFDYIIEIGVTDAELTDILESITRFLVNFNNSAVYEIVDKFHRKFRVKVSSLRTRARSVHFYAVAICQILLLEVSRYSVTPSLTCSKIEREILDHVISFFKLLSLCHNMHAMEDEDDMKESYHILATVVDILNFKDLLWNEIRQSSFTPRILLIICETFPIEKAMWDSLTLRQEYCDLVDSFKVVSLCISQYNWIVTDELILIYDNLFKKRRFSDFAEERDLTECNSVLLSPNKRLSVNTQFNRYLNLIRDCSISSLTIEKITPMSEISASDSTSTVVNRLNLLIVLSSISRFSLENRFQDLIRPLLGEEYLKMRDNASIELLGRSLLNSALSMFRIGASKNYSNKLRGIIPSVFKTYVDGREFMDSIWSRFLTKLAKRFDKLGGYRPLILTDLFLCYTSEEQSTKSRSTDFILVSLIVKNLRFLDPDWVHKFLLPAIKLQAQKSVVWVDNYCEIEKYLVENSILSWWSFYTYNNLVGDYDITLRFSTKIVKMCDTESFKALKKLLFTFATVHIVSDNSNAFSKFLETLAGKESGCSFSQDYRKGLPHKLKSFFRILHRLGYNDLMLKLLDEVAALFESKELTREAVEQTIHYLNKNYIDVVKNHLSFILLRRKLNISNLETERSEFRENLYSLSTTAEQAYFIEQALLGSLTNETSLIIVKDKIKSLFNCPFPFPILAVFQYLISAHASIKIPYLQGISELVLAHLFDILNEGLSLRFYQFTNREFSDVCVIYLEACKRWHIPKGVDLLHQNALYQKILEFELSVLDTSSGFLEYEFLLRATCEQFLGPNACFNSDLGTSYNEIQELLQENLVFYNDSSLIHTDKRSSGECELLLQKWLEHAIQLSNTEKR